MSELNIDFIKNRRKELGIPLETMAKELGFKDASAYFRYEKGEYKFKAGMLPKLADLLQCKLADFFCKAN